jgi:hypothetical protein
MEKAIFDPMGVVATLINRVHRTGVIMMIQVDKAQNRAEKISPHVVDDLETDYLLANIELENMLKSQLAQKNDQGWKLFVDSVSKLNNREKPIFKGVAHNVKLTADNILAGSANPFTTVPFDLPSYILPYAPTGPANVDPDFWKLIIADAEKLEPVNKGIGVGITAVAGAIAAGAEIAAGTVTAPITATVAAVGGAFYGGVEIGNAINHYMGWEEWK